MKVQIIKKQKDPLAMRISIGGNLSEAYFVYRGDLKQIKMLLLGVAEQIEKLESEAPTSDDGEKRYA